MTNSTTDTNAFVDVGEKLGGARKDEWAPSDKKEDSDSVAALWPKPDWKGMIDGTAPPGDPLPRALVATLYAARETMIEHQQRNGAFRTGHTYDEEIGKGRRRFIAGMMGRLPALYCENEGVQFGVLDYAESVFGDAAWVLWSEDDERFFDATSEELEALGDRIIAAAGLVPRPMGMGSFDRGIGAELSKIERERSREEQEIWRSCYEDQVVPADPAMGLPEVTRKVRVVSHEEETARKQAARSRFNRRKRVLVLTEQRLPRAGHGLAQR
jgi:hypothetical protein